MINKDGQGLDHSSLSKFGIDFVNLSLIMRVCNRRYIFRYHYVHSLCQNKEIVLEDFIHLLLIDVYVDITNMLTILNFTTKHINDYKILIITNS